MRIISASRRTDIPAFYSEWFMERIRSGYVRIASPFSKKTSIVDLNPDKVIAIVFWTKDATPLVKHLRELKSSGYAMYFLYTVNNYPKELEPHSPDIGHTLRTIERIEELFEKRIIRWRYDPVVITKQFGVEKCLENFDYLCMLMKKHSDECIFSPCDYYKKTIQKMSGKGLEFVRPDMEQVADISSKMAEIANRHGVSLLCCAHDYLARDGVRKARCIDPVFLGNLLDSDRSIDHIMRLKTPRSRPECGCVQSTDIGAYDTCFFRCAYCYATHRGVPDKDSFLESVKSRDCLDPRFQ